MAFENTIKGTGVRDYNYCIERRPVTGGGYEQVEHIFVCLVSGSVIDLQPGKGVAATVCQLKHTNSYPQVGYAWNGNKFYVTTGGEEVGNAAIYEYDPVKCVVTQVFESLNFLPYHNNRFALANNRAGSFANLGISTDGHFYGTFFRNSGLPGMIRIANGVLDIYNQEPDLKAEIRQGINGQYGHQFTATPSALQGVYTEYFFADDYTPIYATIISDATAAGVTFAGEFQLKLHTADRAAGSATRRVAGACNVSGVDAPGVYTQKVINLKNIADRYIIGFDETSALVWPIGAGTSDFMYNLIGVHGIANPTYAFSNVYASEGRHAGEFMYAASYMENGIRFYGLPYALQDYPSFGIEKGQVIFPLNQSWDRATQLPMNAGSLVGVYKCDFNSNFGFSAGPKYVMFFYSHADGTTKGFLRLDNLQFQAYDPIANPSSYVLSSVTTDAEVLAEFGCMADRFGISTEIGTTVCYTHALLDSAIAEEIAIELNADGGNLCSVTVDYTAQKTSDNLRQATCELIPTVTSEVAGVVELAPNQLAVAGLLYAGIVMYTRSGASLTKTATYTSINSIYQWLRFDATAAIGLGYPNKISVVTSAPVFTKYTIEIKQVLYGCKFSSTLAILCGVNLRVKNYYERYMYVASFNKNTGVSALLVNTPNKFNPLSGQALRGAMGLVQDTYSDADSMTAAVAYAALHGITLSQLITLALATCKYAAFDPVKWSTSKVLVSLNRRQISALRGIRINDQPDQSGTWYDENNGLSADYPAAMYFDKADLTTLVSNDYKEVRFEVSGFVGISTLGRLAASTDYVAFMKNNNSAGNATIYVVTKAAIESAASTGLPITSFFGTYDIALGSTSAAYGFGSGGTGYDFLNASWKPNQCFFTVGNFLFVSVITAVTSGGSKPAIYRVDLATGTTVIYARLNSDNDKALNYNPDTDRCFVSVGTPFYIIDTFSSITTPYDIT